MLSQDLNASRIMQNHNVEQCFISGRSNASSSIMGSSAASSLPPSSTLIGDYIGVESCLDLKDNDDIFVSSSKDKLSTKDAQNFSLCRSRRDQRWATKKEKEFPPPIPLLARTENLPCHMPWVLKRYYTSDGRLILKEERVRHHGYFRAQRCNGRLTLQLVPLDDEVYHPHCFSEEDNNDNHETEHCSNEEENELENYCDEGKKEKGKELENELHNCGSNNQEAKETEENELEGCRNEVEEGKESEDELENCGSEEVEEEKKLGSDLSEVEKEGEIELKKCCHEEEVEGEIEEAAAAGSKIECEDIQVQANYSGGKEEEYVDDCVNDGAHGNGIMKKEIIYDQDQRVASSMDSSGVGGNVSAFKCYNYNRMTMRPASTCIFEMPVPAIRPIHS